MLTVKSISILLSIFLFSAAWRTQQCSKSHGKLCVCQSGIVVTKWRPKAKSPANLKENGYQNLSTQIILAEEIAAVYESSFGYFKANSRFKIDKILKVDRFEHLQHVTPATVQFIAIHPDELRRINSHSGIRIGNSVYQPEKTLSMHNERSYDIYENRVFWVLFEKC